MSQAGIINVIDNNPEIPTSFVADTGSAVPLFNVLQILGDGTFITTSGSGNTITISFNGLAIPETITGNTGGPISPSAGNWNLVTDNSTFIFAGLGSTITLDFNNTNAAIGTELPSLTSGSANCIYGNFSAGNAITSASQNVIIGSASGSAISTGSGNTLVGGNAGAALNGSSLNSAFGFGALRLFTIGADGAGSNTAIGQVALANITTGIHNTGLGNGAGGSYTSTESSNICIKNLGTLGDNNVIRIGTAGSGAGQQSSCFIAGITGVTVAASAPVAVNSNGQLSSLGFGTSGTVLTSNGALTSPTFQAVSVSGAITTITGNSGGAQSPSAGDFNILGTGSITTIGTVNTETIQLTGLTNHALLVGAGTATITKVGPSTSTGQVLQSQGSSTDPAFSTATYPSTAGTASTLLQSDGTNWVNTTATYPGTATSSGTILRANGINWVATVATYPSAISSTGTILRSNGTGYAGSTATYPDATTVNRILYSSATNVIGQITTANNSILSTDGSGVPTLGTSLSNDYTFTTATASATRLVTSSNSDNTSNTSNAGFSATTGGSSGGSPFIRLAIGSTISYCLGANNNATNDPLIIRTAANGTVTPTSAGSIIFQAEAAGSIIKALNPCVNAELTTTITDGTGDGTLISPVIFETDTGAHFDQQSNYDTTTGTFTAPVAGKYLVTAAVTFSDLGVLHTSGTLSISAAGFTYTQFFNPGAVKDSSNRYTANVTCIVPLVATNTCFITASITGSTKTVDILGNGGAGTTRSWVCFDLIS